jgi:tetrahydromethanopterin S-methyltransferase subunit G
MELEELVIKLLLKVNNPATVATLYAVGMFVRSYIRKVKNTNEEYFDRVGKEEISTQMNIIYGDVFVDMRDRINIFHNKGNKSVLVSTIQGESPISCGDYLRDYTTALQNARKSMEKRLFARLKDDYSKYKKPNEKREEFLDEISLTMSKIFTQQVGRETGSTECSKLVENDCLDKNTFYKAIKVVINRLVEK